MFKKVPKKTLSNLGTKLTKLGLSIPQFPPITQILTILKVEVLGRTPPPYGTYSDFLDFLSHHLHQMA